MKRCFGFIYKLLGQDQNQPLMPLLLRSASLTAALISLKDDRFVEGSVRFCTLLGYGSIELLNQTATDLNLWTNIDRNALLRSYQQGIVAQHQCQLRHKSGQLIDLELVIERVHLNRKPHLLLVGVDLSRYTQAEAERHTSLQEKEVLLKEIHHRVRNNLHLISNLLDLQADNLNDRRLTDLFTTAQNRIQAIALIHEQLYQSDNLVQVDFGEYLKRLILNVFLVNTCELGLVKPMIEVETVHLNLETAVPCGLLINELLVNSLKHAFPNRRSGEVHVALYQNDQLIHVSVQDNGIGIAPDLDWQNTASLGFKLVCILAKQLKAKVHLDRTFGTSVQLTFSELKYKPRF